MNLREAFAEYRARAPQAARQIESALLPLRRAGVDTLDQLRELYQDHPDKLKKLRGIGPCRMSMICDLLCFYENLT